MSMYHEIKEQRDKLKGAPFKEKWKYFLDYYKWPTLAILASILLIAFFVRDVKRSSRPIYVNAMFINSVAATDNAILTNEFAEYANIDLEKYQLNLDTLAVIRKDGVDEESYINQQKIFASLAAKDLDCMIADEEVFMTYVPQAVFDDLTTILPKDLLADYENQLVYAYVDELECELPVALDITGIPYFEHMNAYRAYISNVGEDNAHIYFGIIANSLQKDHAVEYLNYMLQFSEPQE